MNVVNPGFEDINGELVQAPFTFGPLLGWELYDPNNITNGGEGNTFFIGTLTPVEIDPINNPGVYNDFFPGGASEGQRMGIAFNFAGSHGIGEYGFVQQLTATVQPNTEYTLQVDIGNIASGPGFDLNGFPGYRIDLIAIDVGASTVSVLKSDLDTLGIGPNLVPEGEFRTTSFSYTTGTTDAELGQTLGIRLVNLNIQDPDFPGADLEVDFDNVRLDAVSVPLPPALPLVGLALLALSRQRNQNPSAS